MRIQIPCLSLVRLQLMDYCVIGEVLDHLYQDNGTWKNANGNEQFSILPTWITPGKPSASCIGFQLSQIVDLAPLRFPDGNSKLKKLKANHVNGLPDVDKSALNLTGAHIPNLNFLRRCDSLSRLHLERLPVSDLAPLAEVAKTLKSLHLSNLPVTNVQVVERLYELTELRLLDLPISQLQLPGSQDLKQLVVSCCPIDRLPPVELCNQLQDINISQTNISSIIQLVDCHNLKELNCWGTSVPESERLAFANRRPDVRLIG